MSPTCCRCRLKTARARAHDQLAPQSVCVCRCRARLPLSFVVSSSFFFSSRGRRHAMLRAVPPVPPSWAVLRVHLQTSARSPIGSRGERSSAPHWWTSHRCHNSSCTSRGLFLVSGRVLFVFVVGYFRGGRERTRPVEWRRKSARGAFGASDDAGRYLHGVGICECCR